jgi:hypothetical protein
MDAIIEFCEEEKEKRIQSCRAFAHYNEKHLHNISVRNFYEKWKERPVTNLNTVPLSLTKMSHGLASMIFFECSHCNEEHHLLLNP